MQCALGLGSLNVKLMTSQIAFESVAFTGTFIQDC